MRSRSIYISEELERQLRELKELRKERSESLTIRNLIAEEYARVIKYKAM